MKIEYTNHSIGNNFGDTIELNEALKNYPRLHDAILMHELKHTNKPFSKEDLLLDLNESSVDKKELIKFMFKHPKSFYQMFPFYWTKKHGFVFDINLILIYFAFIFVLTITMYFALSI